MATKLKLGIQAVYQQRLGIFIFCLIIFGGTSQSIDKREFYIFIFSYIVAILGALEFIFRSEKNKLNTTDWFIFFSVLSVCAYLIPIDLQTWKTLPQREIILSTRISESIIKGPLTLSISPEKTFRSIFLLLPILALYFLSVTSLKKNSIPLKISQTSRWIFGAAALSASIGILQFIVGKSILHPYSITNIGSSTGVFSNANHHACFLILVLAWYYAFKSNDNNLLKNKHLAQIRPLAFVLLLIISILMTKSIAGYIMLSLLNLPHILSRTSIQTIAGRIFLLVVLLIIIVILAISISFIRADFQSSSLTGRIIIYTNTIEGIKEFWPIGSGPGTFQEVYRLFEDKTAISRQYVPNAHNDYLQIILEFGIIGLLLLISALLWFLKNIYTAVIKKHSNNQARWLLFGMSLVAVHSIVDYPMRNASISALLVFTMLCYDKLSIQSTKL